MSTTGFARLREEDSTSSTLPSFSGLVTELQGIFRTGKTKSLEWRRAQLEQIKKMTVENHEEITAAVRRDHAGPKLRGVAENGAFGHAQDALDHLAAWTADETVYTPLMVSPSRMAKSYIRKEPKGVVLVIGPWNFPFELTMHPLVAALAAGNCVVIKPSEVSTHSSALLERLVNQYLDTDCIRVVQGAVPETTALLKEQWDHIFYTGNGHVGRVVMRAAAEHLTPVTLELGGKSPVIIDKSAKLQTAIDRVAQAKFLNVGQICVAPDYILVHKDVEEQFVQGMRKKIVDAFGADPKASSHYGRIINPNHVQRISKLLEDTAGKVVAGGLDTVDAANHYFPPTVVQGAQLGEPLLTEEIFGPVLPVVAVDGIEDAVRKVNSICDQPLALYIFSEDQQVNDTILKNTASGGVCINTCFEHLMNMNLPFGGVGSSGHGAYHGKTGFDEFTHRRSVLHQDTFIMKGASMPDQPKDDLYDIAIKATVTGFLTEAQRQALKMGVWGGGALAAGFLLRSKL